MVVAADRAEIDVVDVDRVDLDQRVTWERRSGRTFDPWADVMSIIGALDSLRDTPPGANARCTIEDMLTSAVTDLGS